MTSNLRLEQVEQGSAHSTVSNGHFANLWNLEDIQALNQTEQAAVAHIATDSHSPGRAASVIEPDTVSLSASLSEREQAMFGHSGEGFYFSQFDNVYGNTSRDSAIAWDPNKLIRDSGEAVLAKVGFFSHRGNEDKEIDYDATQKAYELGHLERLGLPKNIVGAVLRNEQHYFKTTDDDQDRQVIKRGSIFSKDGSENSTASIGPAQMQIRNIRKLVTLTDEHGEPVYPFLQEMKNDPVRAALDKKNAALLVAAELCEIAKDQVQHGIAKPTAEQIVYGYNHDVETYNTGKGKNFISPDPAQLRAERLLHKDLKAEPYPTTPEITKASVHVRHVMHQLAIVDRLYP